MKYLIVVLSFSLSGCGVYVRGTGGTAWNFIGVQSKGVAQYCHPLAAKGGWGTNSWKPERVMKECIAQDLKTRECVKWAE